MDASGQFAIVLLSIILAIWTGWRTCYPFARPPRDPEAESRAKKLLAEMLSERELSQLADTGYLTVPSRNQLDRKYRVPAEPGWVEVYDEGRLAMKLCVEPVHPLPSGDVILMHKLMIEGNEKDYLKTANVVFLGAPSRSALRLRR